MCHKKISGFGTDSWQDDGQECPSYGIALCDFCSLDIHVRAIARTALLPQGLCVKNRFLASAQIHGRTTDKNVHPTESHCTGGLTPHRSPSRHQITVRFKSRTKTRLPWNRSFDRFSFDF